MDLPGISLNKTSYSLLREEFNDAPINISSEDTNISDYAQIVADKYENKLDSSSEITTEVLYNKKKEKNPDSVSYSNSADENPIIQNMFSTVKNNYLDEINKLQNTRKEIQDKREQLVYINTKSDLYIDNVNKNLEKQLKMLDTIESQITNKDRIISINLNDSKNKDFYIYLLKIFGLFSLFGVILIVASMVGKLSKKRLFILLFVIFLLYLIVVIITYNNRTPKKFKTPIFEKKLDNTGCDKNGPISYKEQEWIKDHCKCDPTSEVADPALSYDVKLRNGYYYYDGTAPQQKIVNNNFNKNCRPGSNDNTCKYNNDVRDYSGPCPVNWLYYSKKGHARCWKPKYILYNKDDPLCINAEKKGIPAYKKKYDKKKFEKSCKYYWPRRETYRIDWTSAPDMGNRQTGAYMPGASLSKLNLESSPATKKIDPELWKDIGFDMSDILLRESFKNPGELCDMNAINDDDKCDESKGFYCHRHTYENQARCITDFDKDPKTGHPMVVRPGAQRWDFGLPFARNITNGSNCSNVVKHNDFDLENPGTCTNGL